jgi:hypothetical protein
MVTREMYLPVPHRYYNFKSQSRWKSFKKKQKQNSGLLKDKKGEKKRICVVLHTQCEVDFRLFDSLFFSFLFKQFRGRKYLGSSFSLIAWRLLCMLKPYTFTSIQHQVSLELRINGCGRVISAFEVSVLLWRRLFSYCWLSIDRRDSVCVKAKPVKPWKCLFHHLQKPHSFLDIVHIIFV